MPASNVHVLNARPPRANHLIRLIRELLDRGKVSYSYHAEQERMFERGIDFFDVEAVLRFGDIEGTVRPGNRAGEWQSLVIGKPELDSREMGVAAIVVRRDRLIVKTVEWIDP